MFNMDTFCFNLNSFYVNAKYSDRVDLCVCKSQSDLNIHAHIAQKLYTSAIYDTASLTKCTTVMESDDDAMVFLKVPNAKIWCKNMVEKYIRNTMLTAWYDTQRTKCNLIQ